MCPLRGDFSTGEHHATCFAPICERYDILSIDMMDGAFSSIHISFQDLFISWYMKCLCGKKKLMLLHECNIG
jgi:hypothetical protein